MIRPVILAALSLSAFSLSPAAGEDKRYGPSVTDAESKIGHTVPYVGRSQRGAGYKWSQ
jgi:hypothetical protein